VALIRESDARSSREPFAAGGGFDRDGLRRWRAGTIRTKPHHEARIARRCETKESQMLVLGIVLMLIGLIAGIPILWTVGIVLAVIGAVLLLAERSGASWGRRWY
jgi:hypothetical protein